MSSDLVEIFSRILRLCGIVCSNIHSGYKNICKVWFFVRDKTKYISSIFRPFHERFFLWSATDEKNGSQNPGEKSGARNAMGGKPKKCRESTLKLGEHKNR